MIEYESFEVVGPQFERVLVYIRTVSRTWRHLIVRSYPTMEAAYLALDPFQEYARRAVRP